MKVTGDRYIFDPQHPEVLPLFLPSVLAAHGIDESILLCFSTDLSVDRYRTECYILLSEKHLYRICGVKGIIGEKGRRRQPSFAESDFEMFEAEALSDFAFEELVSSVQLTARKGEERVLLACGSFSVRENVRIAVSYMEEWKKTVKISPSSADQKNIKDGFCPKCGKKYPNPFKKSCPNCEKKSRVIFRTAKLFKNYRLKIGVIVLLLILSGILSVVTPYISAGFFYDQVLDATGSFYGQILLVIFLVVGTRLLSVLLQILYSAFAAVVSSDMVYDLKNVIFSSINRLSVNFFTSRKTGGLMTQVNSDAETIHWFFCEGLPGYTVNIVQVLGAATVMLLADPILALAALLPLPFALMVYKHAYKKMNVLHNRNFVKRSAMNGVLSDMLSGVRVVKAFSGEKQEKKRFSQKNTALAQAELNTTKYSVKVFPVAELLLQLGNTLIWALGGVMILSAFVSPSAVYSHSVITYGTLATFVAYASIMYSQLFSYIFMVSDTADSVNAMGRLIEIMDAEPEITEKENALSFEEMQGEVTFEGVYFGYEPGENVLENVSFKADAGSTLGIVGKTGAGKTTLVNLLIRLYDVTEGSIKIDGVDIRDLKIEYLRKNVAIVSQETYLFVGSILENVRYAKPEASFREVVEACIASGAHDFIMKLRDGYDTKIGQGYADLSGGERQRLSVARAILKNPKILILDEATAAMDTRTEQIVQTAIYALSQGRTTIMIAHRLSTLRDADKLIVIDNKTVAEDGTPGELIRQKGVYYNLYKMQLEALKTIGISEQ